VNTTIEISDALLGEAKKLAARKKIPLRQLIEEGLRAASPHTQHSPVILRFPST
jgi:hypothetical protein